MNIIIVGCGRVGQTVAERLVLEGNNVTVVDTNATKVKEVAGKIDALGVIGNGATHKTQRDAGIDSADILIAVTAADELNLLSCIVAKRSGSCKTIARVRNHEYNDEAPFLKSELELAMAINPEREAAEEIARVLLFPTAISIEPFAKGRVELIKFKLPENSSIVGMSVREVAQKYKCDVLFCTAERQDDAYIVKGDFVFKEKDIISIVATPKNARTFFEKIGYKLQSVKNALIIGGGEVTHYLCSLIERSGIDLRVIESDRQRAEELCYEFPSLTVICANTADEEVLLEEGAAGCDAFLALTDSDEENIFLSLFARSKTNAKLVTKIKRIEYDDVIEKLDLDTVIYPKNIIADRIVRYVRSLQNTEDSNMETLYNVIQGKVEAAEFIVREGSRVAGTPLSELSFKKNILIAAILRGGEFIIPRGQEKIAVGDSVIVISEASVGLYDLSDILE